jgi:hypothetical protein
MSVPGQVELKWKLNCSYNLQDRKATSKCERGGGLARHSPDVRYVECGIPSRRGRLQQNSIAVASLAPTTAGCLASQSRNFLSFVPAQLWRRRPTHLTQLSATSGQVASAAGRQRQDFLALADSRS